MLFHRLLWSIHTLIAIILSQRKTHSEATIGTIFAIFTAICDVVE